MTPDKKPSASDFMAAARKQATTDKTAVLQSRRQVMEDFLAQPAPQQGDLHYNNTHFQRMRARFTLAFGDIFEVLQTLPAKQGKKFHIDINVSPGSGSTYVDCKYKAPGKKGVVSASMTYNSFNLQINYGEQDTISGMRLSDYSQIEMHNNLPSAQMTRSRDIAEMREAIGRAIANIAPERLDDIAKAIDANPHPLDAPQDTTPRTMTAPALPFAKK